jgi:hypothetical protein
MNFNETIHKPVWFFVLLHPSPLHYSPLKYITKKKKSSPFQNIARPGANFTVLRVLRLKTIYIQAKQKSGRKNINNPKNKKKHKKKH